MKKNTDCALDINVQNYKVNWNQIDQYSHRKTAMSYGKSTLYLGWALTQTIFLFTKSYNPNENISNEYIKVFI